MQKSRRNDPCPCGSGRKYKKCCLQREAGGAAFTRSLRTLGYPLFQELARFATHIAGEDPGLVCRAEFPFWRDRLDAARRSRLLEHLMFDYRPKLYGRTAIAQYQLERAAQLAAAQQALLEAWSQTSRRLYVLEDRSGDFACCRDLFAPESETLEIFVAAEELQVVGGLPMALRALPLNEHFFSAAQPLHFPSRSGEEIVEAVRRRHLDFVRGQRIVAFDEFLRLHPTVFDEEAAAPPRTSSIILPGV